MIPSLFGTQEEIIKKIRKIWKLYSFENAQTLSHIFYDVFKIAFYALKRKQKGINQKNKYNIILKRREITRLLKLIDFHHRNDKKFIAERDLTQCFGQGFIENDALKFFEKFVEGDIKDKFGRIINIDLDDGIKFMYKNPETNTHEMKSEYYLPQRGKRLPWIKHTIYNSTNIYTRIDGAEREIMYLAKYELPQLDTENNKCYWAVIVKKNKKDKAGPYNFRTAFPIFKYNSLLARLERYDPIVDIPNV